jgi:hypothetical protein
MIYEPMTYQNGERVRVGDLVRYSEQDARVDEVLRPNTEEAAGYGCEQNGGILVRILRDNDAYLLTRPEEEEDLVFVSRASDMNEKDEEEKRSG